MVAVHDRSLDHYGTEDSLTTTLSAPIGRYPEGMTLQAVLEDFVARLAFIEAVGCDIRIFAFTSDAVINEVQTPSLTADAMVRDPSKELTVDALIFKTQTPTLAADAAIVEEVICF